MAATITENTANAKFPNLETQIARAMVPTPTVWEATRGIVEPKENFYKAGDSYRRRNKNGSSSYLGLAQTVSMLPTPTTQDAANNGGPSQYNRNSLPLNAVVGGALNPMWVEWLMGYPQNWTFTED